MKLSSKAKIVDEFRSAGRSEGKFEEIWLACLGDCRDFFERGTIAVEKIAEAKVKTGDGLKVLIAEIVILEREIQRLKESISPPIKK